MKAEASTENADFPEATRQRWLALAEKALAGKVIDAKSATEAAKAAMKGARPMTQNEYKVGLFQTVIRRAILAAALGPEGGGQS